MRSEHFGIDLAAGLGVLESSSHVVLVDERIHPGQKPRGKLDVCGVLLSRQQLEIGRVVERLRARYVGANSFEVQADQGELATVLFEHPAQQRAAGL